MFRKNIKKILSLALLFTLGNFGFIFAQGQNQSCPTNTTVSGTTVMFVGELTDMGGDAANSVWFEYGKTTNYGEKTIEKTLSNAGIYCISITGLSPSTTYHYRAAARNSAGTSYGENKSFTTTSGPTVDLKANGSSGPIAIDHNSSVNLGWISSNVDYCIASGGWSGSKSIIGSQTISNLNSSKTFTLNCSGPGGSASDSVTVNIGSPASADFLINKTVRNLSKATGYSKTVYADPGEVLVFGIVVQAGNEPLSNVIVKDIFPTGLSYHEDLRVDNVLTTGDIFTGLNLGNFSANQKKTITFQATVAGADNFPFGQTELFNSVLVSSEDISVSDSAKVIVSKTAVAGVATVVPTGLTNNVFIDSFLLPLAMTLLIIWIFKSRIIKIEEWMDKRKKEYQVYKSKKILGLKVSKIKFQEFFGKAK